MIRFPQNCDKVRNFCRNCLIFCKFFCLRVFWGCEMEWFMCCGALDFGGLGLFFLVYRTCDPGFTSCSTLVTAMLPSKSSAERIMP